MALFDFFRPDPLSEAAYRLYAMAAEQSRLPIFYTEFGVADSFDGRFDLLALHVHLLIRRLNGAGREGRRFAQLVFDVMLKDLDQGLRLVGVGDTGIGKRVKRMSNAYYGRARAYDAALDAGDAAALSAALSRNVYRGNDIAPAVLQRLTDYVWQRADALERTSLAALTTAQFTYAAPHDGEVR